MDPSDTLSERLLTSRQGPKERLSERIAEPIDAELVSQVNEDRVVKRIAEQIVQHYIPEAEDQSIILFMGSEPQIVEESRGTCSDLLCCIVEKLV